MCGTAAEGKEETKQGIHALSKHRNSGARHLERSRLPAHNITAVQPDQPVTWLCRDTNMTQHTQQCHYLYTLSATSESVMNMKLGHDDGKYAHTSGMYVYWSAMEQLAV